MYRCLLTVLASVALSMPVAAQVQRQFPQNALRGTIAFGTPPQIKLNGRDWQLAPGHQIRNQANLLTMSGALMGASAVVNYTIDTQGLVHRIWILRPEEVAVRPWPTQPEQSQTWAFDPVAQTWTRP